jgi:FkbM family methyltransferase
MKIPSWLCPQSIRDATRFYRTHSVLELLHHKGLSLGQEGEDIILQKCFFSRQDRGFYVDVGAFDPFHLSNTHIFYRRGWCGINIEPNPDGYRKLQKHRKRDINLNLAVSDTEREVRFTVESVFSSINDGNGDPGPRRGARQITVKAKPLRIILDQYRPAQMAIDFMSVDCEGHDRIVLESNDWNRHRPRVLLVEDMCREKDAEINRYLEGKGYVLFFHLQLTKIFVDPSAGLLD